MTVAPDPGTDLCTRCGLCCDGTLYGSVVVDTAETARLERVGLPVVSGEAPVLPQPCTALSGCLCAVYADRPSACARYVCDLRRSVDQGARDLDETLAVIEEAKALVARFRADLGLDPATSIWQGVAALEAPPTAEAERAWAEAHVDGLAAVAQLIVLVREKLDARFAGGGPR